MPFAANIVNVCVAPHSPLGGGTIIEWVLCHVAVRHNTNVSTGPRCGRAELSPHQAGRLPRTPLHESTRRRRATLLAPRFCAEGEPQTSAFDEGGFSCERRSSEARPSRSCLMHKGNVKLSSVSVGHSMFRVSRTHGTRRCLPHARVFRRLGRLPNRPRQRTREI